MDIFGLFDLDILAASIRVSIPIMLAALGGLLCLRAGVFNIALEGHDAGRLVLRHRRHGGDGRPWGSRSGIPSTWFGIIGGLLGGLALSMVFAVSILRFKADHIVAGIAINLLALGVTGFALKTIFDAQGVFRPDGHGAAAQDHPPGDRGHPVRGPDALGPHAAGVPHVRHRRSSPGSRCTGCHPGCGSGAWASSPMPRARRASTSTGCATRRSRGAACCAASRARTCRWATRPSSPRT